MITDFGTDLTHLPDVTGQLVSGGENLIQALARRIQTPKGSLFYDPSYGSTLYDWLGEGIEDGGLALAVSLEVDIEEDPRVRSCTVNVTNLHLRGIELSAHVDTNSGPLELIIAGDIASSSVYPNVEVNARGFDL